MYHRVLFLLLLAACSFFFFFNDTATTEIYTLSLHDALPISTIGGDTTHYLERTAKVQWGRSEEHTSELQSHDNLVCRLLLEKKKQNNNNIVSTWGTSHMAPTRQQLLR